MLITVNYMRNLCACRQLQMLLTLAETNPGLLGQMGMAARGLMQELSRLEKLKELKVCC